MNGAGKVFRVGLAGKLLFGALVLMTSVVTGLAVAVLPPGALFAFLLLPIAFVAASLWPVAGLAIVMILAFGLLPTELVMAMPLGQGSVRQHELVLLLIFVAFAYRAILDRHAMVPAVRRIWLPLSMLGLAVAIALIKGRVISHNQFALADLRQLTAWLALPIAIWIGVRKPDSLRYLAIGVSLFGAIAILVQGLTGNQVIQGTAGAQELSSDFRDVVRTMIGGGMVLLIFSAIYAIARSSELGGRRVLWGVLAIVLLGGTVATFTRGIWFGLLVGGIVALIALPKRGISLLPSILVLGFLGAVVGAGLSAVKPRYLEAVADRVFSVSKEGDRGSSVGFRFDENAQAFEAIKKSPILGAGLGAEYKQVLRNSGRGFVNEVSFVHNAYLALWLKLGVLGFLFPFVLVGVLWRATAFVFRESNIAHQRIEVASAFGAMVGMAVYGGSSPEWNQFGDILAASVLMGIILGAGAQFESSPKQRTHFHAIGSTKS